MNIVIISMCDSAGLAFIHAVAGKFNNVKVVQPISVKDGKAGKKKLSWFISKIIDKIGALRLAKGFNLSQYPAVVYEKLQVDSKVINLPEGIESIKYLEPDILITCGAPILKQEVIDTARVAALNIHFGIAPFYRGNNTLFWALYHNDFEKVGGSIHYLSKGIDDGNLLACVYPRLEKNDDDVTVTVKTVKLISTAALEVIQRIKQADNIPAGQGQTEKGANFRLKDKTLDITLRFYRKRYLSTWRAMPTPERIDFFI
jgi:methionyl-tRNA formyltransferase